MLMEMIYIYTGWWYTYPSEKYESQLGWLFPIYGNIKTVPNHQPEYDIQSWHNLKILGVKRNETIGFEVRFKQQIGEWGYYPQ